jgi:hypothetical protein
VNAEDAGNVTGWVLEHGQTLFFLLAGVTAVVVLMRVVYTVMQALSDLRLRRAGGDAATELAAWLREQNGGVDPSRRGGRGGRHSLVYETYLQSPQWAQRRQRTLLLAGGACQRCGTHATDAHHTTYARLGHERDGDLEALCGGCHRAAHGR